MQLSELGYSPAEISELNAERAAAIIKHSISRPSGGVPASWKKSARGNPARSAVRAIGKSFGGLPPIALAPAAIVLLGGVGAFARKGSDDGGSKSAAAVAAALAEPEEIAVPTKPVQSSELWLDRQIDKLIDLFKSLFGR